MSRRSRSRSSSPASRRRFSDREDPHLQRSYRRRNERRALEERDSRPDRREKERDYRPDRREKVRRFSGDDREDRRRYMYDDRRDRRRSWREEDRQRNTDTPQVQEKLQDEKEMVTNEHRRAGGGGMEGRRTNFEERRRSSRDGERGRDAIKPIVVNPMEVPKSNKYFTHDDREVRGSGMLGVAKNKVITPAQWGHDMFEKLDHDNRGSRGREGGGLGGTRRPKAITPTKWGHDMFEKLYSHEGTPPLEEGTDKEDRMKSFVVGSDQKHEDIMDSSQESGFQALELYPEAEL